MTVPGTPQASGTPFLVDAEHVAMALRELLTEGEVAEMRVLEGREAWGHGKLSPPRTYCGYFDDPSKVAPALAKLGAWHGVYFTPNPVDPLLLNRCANRLAVAKRGQATTDLQIVQRRWLLIDFDPIVWGKDGPIKGIAATDAEKAHATARALRVKANLEAAGWPTPLVGDSGNGAHLMFRVDLPAASDLPARVLATLAAVYGDKEGSAPDWNRSATVTVDTSVSNAARIWKLPGTMACKGEGIGDRPWRQARIVTATATWDPPLSADAIEAWIASVSAPVAAPQQSPAATPTDRQADPAGKRSNTDLATGMLARAGVEVSPGADKPDGSTVYDLPSCLCERGEKGAFLSVAQSGGIGLGCLHESCRWSTSKTTPGAHWRTWREEHRELAAGGTSDDRGGGDGKVFDRGDDVELGLDLAERLGGSELAVHDLGDVYRCEDALWRPVDDPVLRSMAHDYAGRAKWGKKTSDGASTTAPIRLAQANVKGIATVAADRLHRPGFFGEAPSGAAFVGSFAYVVGEKGATSIPVEPLRPEHRVRAADVSPFELAPAGSPLPPVAYAFLRETWAGCSDVEHRIRYLLGWIGLALLGLAQRHKDSPLLVGRKDTGKSQALSIVAFVFPVAARRAVPVQAFGNEYQRAHLSRGRINIVNELPSNDVLQSEEAKAILSGDAVTCRLPCRDPYTWNPRIGCAFACNELPTILDRALVERFVVLNCDNVVPPDRQDRTLAARLEAEAPLIARAALDEALAILRRGGIVRPPSAQALAEAWVRDSDPVATWAAEALEMSDTDRLPSQALYDDFCRWGRDTGHKQMALLKFSKRLLALRFEKHKTGGVMCWHARRTSAAEASARQAWNGR